MKFVDLKIRTKLSLAFGVLILTGILLSVGTIYTLLMFRHRITSFTGDFLPQLRLSNNIGSAAQMVAFNMEGYYLTGSADYFSKAKKQLDSLKMSLEKGVALLENSKDLDKLEQCLSEAKILIPQHEQNAMMAFKLFQDVEILKDRVESARNKATSIENQAKGKKKKAAVSPKLERNSEFDRLSSELQEKTDQLDKLKVADQQILANIKKAAEALDTSVIEYANGIGAGFNKTIRYSLTVTFFIALISLAFVLFAIFFISRQITNPLIKGIDFARKLAKGDLTADLEIRQKDEIGILGHNLQMMGTRFREVLTYVSSTSENLAAASLELSSTSQSFSQGASEQASSAEEVSAAIEEMVANIHQNNENALLTEQIAVGAEKNIQVGREKVQQTIDAIRNITEKTSIIGEIAFQTNILALNAAVEAARAGEYGRGFGVVAAEVGKLAERSKVAALEIEKLTKSSVQNAEETGKLMNEIVPEIQKTSRLVQEISSASREQNTGADQINKAIQQLNLVTQQNAASSEELATNAVELSAQSEQLREIISFFNIGIAASSKTVTATESVPEEKMPKKTSTEAKKGVVIELDVPYSTDEDFERF